MVEKNNQLITVGEVLKRMEMALSSNDVYAFRTETPGKSVLYPVGKLLAEERHSRAGTYVYYGNLPQEEIDKLLEEKSTFNNYHAEDSFNVHMQMVYTHFLNEMFKNIGGFEELNLFYDEIFDAHNVHHMTAIIGALAARLHDIGKPYTRRLHIKRLPNGEKLPVFIYQGHHIVGANIARVLLPQLFARMFDGIDISNISLQRIYYSVLWLILLHQTKDVHDFVNNVFSRMENIPILDDYNGVNRSVHYYVRRIYPLLTKADKLGMLRYSSIKLSELKPSETSNEGYVIYGDNNDAIKLIHKRVSEARYSNSNKSKTVVVTLMGPSNSGKDTFLKLFREQIDSTIIRSFDVISYDDLRVELYAKEFNIDVSEVDYNKAHAYFSSNKGLQKLNNAYNKRRKELLNKGLDVLFINNTNVSKKAHNRAVPNNVHDIYAYIVVMFDVGIEELYRRELERRKTTSKRVPISTIKTQFLHINPLVDSFTVYGYKGNRKSTPTDLVWISDNRFLNRDYELSKF